MASIGRRQFTGALAAAALAASVLEDSPGMLRAGESGKKKPIRIGQIGVGHAHATKLAVYRRSPDYEVVGIAEPDPELRKHAAAISPYRDLPWLSQEQLLNVPGLQAVLVETQVPDLVPTAAACIAAGKHVHLDKPAGESLPPFRRLLEAAARQKLVVQMGYMFRYNPGVMLLREFLKKGYLGEPFEVHGVISKVVPAGDRRRMAWSRGGMMLELGSHVIDLVVGLLGKPREVQSFAQHISPTDDGLLDNMLAVLRYPRTLASVKSTALEVEGFERRHLVVCGTEGTFHIQPLDNPSARVALAKARGGYRAGYQDVRFGKYERYVADAADMARILRGEKQPDFSYEHDLAVHETLLRASGLPCD